MKLEFSRRTFLILLGTTAAVATVGRRKPLASVPNSGKPEGICFFTDHCSRPSAQPRTAAITYLSL